MDRRFLLVGQRKQPLFLIQYYEPSRRIMRRLHPENAFGFHDESSSEQEPQRSATHRRIVEEENFLKQLGRRGF